MEGGDPAFALVVVACMHRVTNHNVIYEVSEFIAPVWSLHFAFCSLHFVFTAE